MISPCVPAPLVFQIVAAAVASGSLGRVIRLRVLLVLLVSKSATCSTRTETISFVCFSKNLAACDAFSRAICRSRIRDGRADCPFGSTARARFACQNHRPAREKRPRQATHVCRRRTCFLRRRWALVSPTGRLKFPCLLLPESSILCQHVHAVLPLAFA